MRNVIRVQQRYRALVHCLLFLTGTAVIGCAQVAPEAESSYGAEDRALIKELLDRHQVYIDLADVDRYADLFAPDAEYESFFASAVGRDEIREMSRSLHASGFTADKRHFAGPSVIEFDSVGAQVLSYWWVVDTDGEPSIFATGTYEDRLKKIDGRWVIVRRVLWSDQEQSNG